MSSVCESDAHANNKAIAAPALVVFERLQSDPTRSAQLGSVSSLEMFPYHRIATVMIEAANTQKAHKIAAVSMS